MITSRTITLGSRPSKLARWQTGHILELLKASWPDLDLRMVTLVTEGDKILDRPLPEIGGKGVFTAELEAALRLGEIDLAVHSLKDLPVENASGLCIGAIGKRADARDAFISAKYASLSELPEGAKVGSSSLRREAQVRALRPDLVVCPLRGNVDTRIRKAMDGVYDGILLAAAGIERLGLDQYIREYLPLDAVLPAPGQGALAVQCREDDLELIDLLQTVQDVDTFRAVTAERSFLAGLGGGCSAPIAAYARVKEEEIDLTGLVASTDGQRVIRVQGCGEVAIRLGGQLAREALDQGAGELLK